MQFGHAATSTYTLFHINSLILVLITHSFPLKPFQTCIPVSLHTTTLTQMHTLSCDEFPANRDYGAIAVACWDGADTLSLTKEIYFSVPRPSCKAASKGRGGCFPHHFSSVDRLWHNRKSNYTICAFQSACWALRAQAKWWKVGSKTCWKGQVGEEGNRRVCDYILEVSGLKLFSTMQVHSFFPGSIITRHHPPGRESEGQRGVEESNYRGGGWHTEIVLCWPPWHSS